MSLTNWRQFPFFESVPIQDPNYGTPNALYSDLGVSAISATPDLLVLATAQGSVRLVNKLFEPVFEFQAYELGWDITRVLFVPFQGIDGHNGFLCTIAEKQGQPVTLKLWDLAKIQTLRKLDYNTDYHSLCQVTNGTNDFPLTCFDSTPAFSVLVFGFANGTVIVVRGDLLHDRGSRQRVVYESKDPITGVHFRDDSMLYVSNVSTIFTIPTTGRNQGRPDRVLDDSMGVDINCSAVVHDQKRNLVVARDQSLQFYNLRGKTHNLLLDIPKRRIFTYKDRYVVIVSSVSSSLTAASSIVTNKLIVVDVVNKFIALNQTITNTVVEIFVLWDSLYVFNSDGLLFQLKEKDLAEKLDLLVQRELFNIAIKLAEDENYSAEQLLKIRKQYGDYLYDKGELEEATKQYMDSIDLGKTSEIIQKYKESFKIPFLAEYLEKLVSTGKSSIDHTTLLLCCYCKLKKPEKIQEYYESVPIDEDYQVIEKHREFDMQTIISVCRESGYSVLAANIAKKFNVPSIVVDIQLHDMKNSELTMKYIRTLPIDDLLRVLIDNVKWFLDSVPNECTLLLIDVFTGRYSPEPAFDLEELSAAPKSNVSHPILTSYRQFVSFMNLADTEELPDTQPTYLPPRPRIIFQSFVNHPNEFVIFLEACIESYDKFGGNEKDKKDIMITLYEMYLTMSTTKDKAETALWQGKAKALLETIQKSQWDLQDQTDLLLLSNLGEFNEAEIIIRETADDSAQGFELDMFRSSILAQNYDKSLEIIEKYGSKEPDLYKLALSVYTSSEKVFNQIGEEKVASLIMKIDSLKLMTPLELVKLLSKTSFVKLGLIKGYLVEHIGRQKQEIAKNEKLIQSYQQEAATISDELAKQNSEPQVINRSKCSSCGRSLSFPIVHFRCSHSYHESCLANEFTQSSSAEQSCPKCAGELDTLAILTKQHEEAGKRNDLFKASLVDSSDRFKVMMSFFGRGAMQQTKTIWQDK
ncbi:hypothetical protein OGAPHI_003830 [Ogataea philodendri]|uniref:E3 ubiquitin-protein ligase PEP5 n=1 Tax=Ogataea philodendri TaxID=1378263 RepID=A0A9P8P5K7_9ASCO|nr:uncharacterized protein OGAPHI_003830 [Ogataea philodendri]KAH3665642.1 hypothetical protein OGAPHI_003830 [Ogataea philodendri]